MDPEIQHEIDQRMKILADKIERDARAKQWILDSLSIGLVFLTLGWTALGVMLVAPIMARKHPNEAIPSPTTRETKSMLVDEEKVKRDDYETLRRKLQGTDRP